MKKVMIFVMVAAMLAACGSAFAADTQGHDVYGEYYGERVDKYSVDVAWGGMHFKFVAATEEWDAVNHEWKPVEGGVNEWVIKEGSSNEITVTNHSSYAVNVDLTATMTEAGLGGEFSKTTFKLAIPQQGPNGATSEMVTFKPTGTLSNTMTAPAKIGEITVTID